MSQDATQTLLENTTPQILRQMAPSEPFAVVADRAVNVWVADAGLRTIPTDDWDVALIGEGKSTQDFANDFASRLRAQGNNAQVINKKGDPDLGPDPFVFRSRPWSRVKSKVDGKDVVVLDVYSFDADQGVGTFMINDGLLYSDMGFLVRELNRTAKALKQQAATLLPAVLSSPIGEKLLKLRTCLNESGFELAEIHQAMEAITDSAMSKLSPQKKEELKHQMAKLCKVKHSLQNILVEREALFMAAASGMLRKEHSEEICHSCRDYEQQYGDMNELDQEMTRLS